MLRNYYINREFIVSSTARAIYRASAWLTLGLFFGVIAINIFWQALSPYWPTVLLFLQIGSIGAGVTMVAMEYFLFAFDKSSFSKKVLWFCVMAFLPLAGAALYCLVAYSKSVPSNADTLVLHKSKSAF